PEQPLQEALVAAVAAHDLERVVVAEPEETALAVSEAVEDGDAPAVGQQCLGEDRADVPRAAGHQDRGRGCGHFTAERTTSQMRSLSAWRSEGASGRNSPV